MNVVTITCGGGARSSIACEEASWVLGVPGRLAVWMAALSVARFLPQGCLWVLCCIAASVKKGLSGGLSSWDSSCGAGSGHRDRPLRCVPASLVARIFVPDEACSTGMRRTNSLGPAVARQPYCSSDALAGLLVKNEK